MIWIGPAVVAFAAITLLGVCIAYIMGLSRRVAIRAVCTGSLLLALPVSVALGSAAVGDELKFDARVEVVERFDVDRAVSSPHGWVIADQEYRCVGFPTRAEIVDEARNHLGTFVSGGSIKKAVVAALDELATDDYFCSIHEPKAPPKHFGPGLAVEKGS